jgi:hypothetical protein
MDSFFASMLGQESDKESLPKEIEVVERTKSGKRATCIYCGKIFEYESEGWAVFHAESGECKCGSCLAKNG